MPKKSQETDISVRRREISLTRTGQKSEEILGKVRSHEEVMDIIMGDPGMKDQYERLKPEMKEQVVGFLEGTRSLCILYDNFFRKIFDPYVHRERIERLISALFGQRVKIRDVLPREGFEIIDEGSLVIMDILVELESGSIVNVEMQKVGYLFPSQRSSCYAADIVMRQYNKKKNDLGNRFTYKDISPVYLFVLMEKSPESFKNASSYITRREVSYSSGINLPETVNITYITLDKFNDRIDNKIEVESTDDELYTWLTFLSRDDAESVVRLVDSHPEFAEIYHEIALFREDPGEVMKMFSEALAFLDKNTERYMVDYYADKAEAETVRADKAEERADKAESELRIETERAGKAESELKIETVRADKAEERADKAEERADKAEKARLADKRDSAIKMLKDGQSVKKVSEYLSVSEEELQKIREEVADQQKI